MSAVKKPRIGVELQYIQDAIREGRASLQRLSMKALGTLDRKYQAREVGLDIDHVRTLSAIHDDRGELSPGVVFRDRKTGKLALADGHHRHEVYRAKKLPDFPAYVIESDDLHADALAYCTMCNQVLCLGRTKQDIRKAVFMLLQEPTWFDRSSYMLASHVGVSNGSAQRYRLEFCKEQGVKAPLETVDRNGVSKRCRNAPPTIKPRLTKNGTVAYRAAYKGGLIFLGTDKDKAEERLQDEIDRIDNVATNNKFALQADSIYKRLLERRLGPGYAANSPGCGFGSAIILAGTAVVTAESLDYQTAADTVGRCLLNRAAHMPEGRAVVLVHEHPTGEVFDVARRLGVEFLTFDELVASIERVV